MGVEFDSDMDDFDANQAIDSPWALRKYPIHVRALQGRDHGNILRGAIYSARGWTTDSFGVEQLRVLAEDGRMIDYPAAMFVDHEAEMQRAKTEAIAGVLKDYYAGQDDAGQF